MVDRYSILARHLSVERGVAVEYIRRLNPLY